MSWHCSQALVEAFSAVICSDGEPFAPSNTTPMPDQYYWPDKTTEHSRLSRFGMTCVPLTADRGTELLMSYLAAFPAKTSAQPVRAQESTANEADYGVRWQGSLARYDHSTSSWKTAQCSLLGDWDVYSETWPRWGMTVGGALYLLPTPELRTSESESGFLPTPLAIDSGSGRMNKGLNPGAKPRPTLALMARKNLWPTPCARDYKGIGRSRLERTGSTAGECLPQAVGGMLNPDWAEWLMAFPIGWTGLKPLETHKFQQWQQQHGNF